MAFALTRTFSRLWSLDAGIAMVVTDLHGEWDAYRRYRDLAVTGPDDPRYDDLLRGFVVTANPDFQLLYSALFTRCEQDYGLDEYAETLRLALQHLSADYAPQHVLVAGHMAVQNGFEIIAEKHLRIASGSHAKPREAGRYLLFDTARPINGAADLLPSLHTVYSA